MSSIRRTALLIAMTGMALPALAFARPDTPPKPKKVLDPNEMICTRDPELGSRLSVRKICLTRAQRAERAASDRQLVERAQTSSCLKGSGC